MTTRAAGASSRYLKLIKTFPLRPIRTDDELGAASAAADALSARADLDDDERDYLEVLGDLIIAYENAQHPIADVPGPSLLRFLIESKGVSQSEVARQCGMAVSTVNEILSGKRGLGTRHIEAFARYFAVEPAVFLPEARGE